MRPIWMVWIPLMVIAVPLAAIASPVPAGIRSQTTTLSAPAAESFVLDGAPSTSRGERGHTPANPLDENNGQWYGWSGTLAIPDVQCPTLVVAPLSVTQSGVVVDVEVTISTLTHTYDGDLRIYLRGPTGVQTALCLQRGYDGDNFVNTHFDDHAESPIATGSAPFSNSFIPESPLNSAYYGSTAAGTWQLEICDAAGQDIGTLWEWRLQLRTAACLPPPWNDDCWSVAPVGLPATFYGTTDCASADCPGILSFTNVWIAFTTTQVCDVVLKYCDTDNPYTNAWLNLFGSCSCTGMSTAGTWDTTSCPDGRLTIRWLDVPAGTYYYPVLNDPPLGSSGPYVISVSCESLGRCCYGNPQAPSCLNRTEGECEALSGVWSEGLSCETPCPLPTTCPSLSHISQLPTSPTGPWSFHVSEEAAGYTCYERIPGAMILKHLRFWGMPLQWDDSWYACGENPLSVMVQVHGDSNGYPGAAFFAGWPVPVGVPGNLYGITSPPTPLYQYDVEFGGVASGSNLWLSITGQGDPNCMLLWVNSPTGANAAVQRGPDGEWYPLGTNLALCITGADCVPAASSCPGRVIPALPFGELGNTACATNSMEQCAYPGSLTPYNVYVYTAPACETVTVNLCSSVYDTQLEVRTGGTCPGTTRVACNDDNTVCGGDGLRSYLSFTALAAQTYYVILGGYAGQTGAYSLWMHSTPFASPNDLCPGTSITALPYWDTGDTRCAQDNYTWSCSPLDGAEVVYNLTLPTCQRVTATLCPSGYDTGIEVRTGGACPGSTMVICNDDNFCDGEYVVQSEVTFDAQPGVTYSIFVDGYNGAAGPFYLGLTGVPCPVLDSPTELVAQRSGQNIRLNWRRAAGATMYKVFRGTTQGFVPDGSTYVATVTDSVWLDMNIVSNPPTLYFYAVTSVNSSSLSMDPPAEKATMQGASQVPLDLYRIANEEFARPDKASPK